jgi:hypothetical protein
VSTSGSVPACAICGKPVPLETAKGDEDGRSVHEQCYVLKLTRDRAAPEPGWQRSSASDAVPWSDA